MRIWVDADACPNVIKDILFRAAINRKIELTLIANHVISAPASPFIKKLQVGAGFDVADDKIVEKVEEKDLVITADIPLANLVIEKKAHALNPRGELYTPTNIKERLAIRNFNAELRSGGVITGGPAGLDKRDVQKFANALDKLLAQIKR